MEAAVSPALYVITQDYYLKKDNLRYGKTSNTPWGTATGFAVNIGGQLYTTASILRAWEYDAQYKAKGFNGGAFGALKYRRVLATDASEKMGAELKTDTPEMLREPEPEPMAAPLPDAENESTFRAPQFGLIDRD